MFVGRVFFKAGRLADCIRIDTDYPWNIIKRTSRLTDGKLIWRNVNIKYGAALQLSHANYF